MKPSASSSLLSLYRYTFSATNCQRLALLMFSLFNKGLLRHHRGIKKRMLLPQSFATFQTLPMVKVKKMKGNEVCYFFPSSFLSKINHQGTLNGASPVPKPAMKMGTVLSWIHRSDKIHIGKRNRENDSRKISKGGLE